METEYLGFWVIKDRARPLLSKVYSVKAIGTPYKVCDINRLFGLVNYDKDTRSKLTHTLYTLTKLCYTKTKFNWNDVEQN